MFRVLGLGLKLQFVGFRAEGLGSYDLGLRGLGFWLRLS